MKFCFPLRAPVAALLALAMLSRAGLAADGAITFTGAVTENSCTVRVNDGVAEGTVALPVVDTGTLTHPPGQHDATAGTFFTLTLGNCRMPAQVAVYFEAGPTVDPGSHALINAGTSNVEVKLYEAAGDTVVGKQISPGVSAGLPLAGEGTWHFYAGYALAAAAQARAGTVSAAVTYSLVYQ